ncbi:unnamed protein product [Discula destructiva]
MFYEFSLADHVDDKNSKSTIYACSSYGSDFSVIPASTNPIAPVEPVHVVFQIGWWEEGFGLAATSLQSLVQQMRQYLDKGHGVTDKPVIMFGQFGVATIGIYIG